MSNNFSGGNLQSSKQSYEHQANSVSYNRSNHEKSVSEVSSNSILGSESVNHVNNTTVHKKESSNDISGNNSYQSELNNCISNNSLHHSETGSGVSGDKMCHHSSCQYQSDGTNGFACNNNSRIEETPVTLVSKLIMDEIRNGSLTELDCSCSNNESDVTCTIQLNDSDSAFNCTTQQHHTNGNDTASISPLPKSGVLWPRLTRTTVQ